MKEGLTYNSDVRKEVSIFEKKWKKFNQKYRNNSVNEQITEIDRKIDGRMDRSIA